MVFLFVAIAVVTATTPGLAYKKLGLAGGPVTAPFLPAFWFLPLSLAFGIWSAIRGDWFWGTEMLFPVILGAFASFITAFCLLESLRRNSFSLAIIIINLSFVFPIIMSLIYPGEKVGIFQLIGMLLAIAVIIFMNAGKGDLRGPFMALFFAVMSSLGNGTIQYAIKLSRILAPEMPDPNYFCYVYGLATVLSLLVTGFLCLIGKKPDFGPDMRKITLRCAPVIAVSNGFCFFSQSRLATMMNAAMEFTIITTLTIVLSLLADGIINRTKLTWKDWVSLALCGVVIFFQCIA